MSTRTLCPKCLAIFATNYMTYDNIHKTKLFATKTFEKLAKQTTASFVIQKLPWQCVNFKDNFQKLLFWEIFPLRRFLFNNISTPATGGEWLLRFLEAKTEEKHKKCKFFLYPSRDQFSPFACRLQNIPKKRIIISCFYFGDQKGRNVQIFNKYTFLRYLLILKIYTVTDVDLQCNNFSEFNF